MTTDTLTILTNIPDRYGRIPAATKTLGRSLDGAWQKSAPYKNGMRFKHSTVTVSNIFSLNEAVARISRDPTSFCIRGSLKDRVDTSQLVYRRSQSKNGDTAHFEEKPRYSLMLDFDKASVCDLVDLFDDPESAVEDLIYRHLPKRFHDVSCVWQLSSGAATTDPDGTLSLHLWFWLDRPMGQEELTLFFAAHASTVDRAVFRTVQPLYTAAPTFTPPHHDPLPRRIGMMQREYDCLTLPSINVNELRHKTTVVAGTGLISHVHGFEAKLKLLGDGQGLSGFNDVIPAAIAAYVFKRYPHEVDQTAVKNSIRAAIEKAPVSIHRSQQDLIRYKSDDYIDECIHTAMNKFCLKSIQPLYPAPTMSVSDVRCRFALNLKAVVDTEIERLAA